MVQVVRWLPSLAALMVSALGSFMLVMAYTTPDGEFGVLGALPVMLTGMVLGISQRRWWAGVTAIVLPAVVFTFLWFHGPFCHWDG